MEHRRQFTLVEQIFAALVKELRLSLVRVKASVAPVVVLAFRLYAKAHL